MGQTRKNSSGEMKSNFAQGHFTFSPSDSASIYSIASLCPALGGKAVYKARSLYALLNDTIYFDDASICRQQGMQYRRQDTAQAFASEANIKLYPNPTSDLLNIEFDTMPLSKVHIQITNLLGQTLYAKTHAATVTLSISMSEMQTKSGLYLIRVSTSDDLINFNSKFIYEK